MSKTTFKNDLECTGKFTAGSAEVTGEMKADSMKVAAFAGALIAGAKISKAADYSLSAAQKAAPYVGAEMTAESKTLTLGLAANQVMLVHNAGATNAFTLKNVSGDTGTSLAAGKVALVVGSTTANASTVLPLN